MSISEMGVMCSKMSFRQKRKHLNIERNQQRVRVLYQRCLKIGVHIVIFMKYILLNSLYINYTFLAFNVIVDANVKQIRSL